MFKDIQLWRLKGKARKLYLELDRAYSSLDCGWKFADSMGLGSVITIKVELRDVWAQIMQLDPNAPQLPDWAR